MALKMTLCLNKSSSNTLNKTLDNPYEVDIILKNNDNLTNPTVKILGFNNDLVYWQTKYNYCYIQYPISRYYFIENIEVDTANICTLYLKCDLLMSFRSLYMGLQASIKKSTNYNKYYNDGSYKSLETKQNYNYQFSNKPFDFSSTDIVLVTIGGI